MPTVLTYPGVYIEEIPSGVRTITGVATSITAFIGRAQRGSSNAPVTINSFGDFEREFGGLHPEYPMSYAVQDFYLNGGSQAIIVRLFKKGTDGDGTAKLSVSLPSGGNLDLEAAYPGEWGNNLSATADKKGITDDVALRYELPLSDLFNLTIEEKSNGKTQRAEKFLNLSVQPNAGSRRVDRVLAEDSELVLVAPPAPTPPAPAPTPPAPTPPAPTPPAPAPAPQTPNGTNGQPLAAEDYIGDQNLKTGLYALEKVDLFNLLCIPPDSREGDGQNIPDTVYQEAMRYCQTRRAMLIVDPPTKWSENKDKAAAEARDGLSSLNLTGEEARNALIYFPRILKADLKREGQIDSFAACGAMAGIMARTDATRGVWKAPAGLDATLNGIQGLEVNLNDAENGMLNPLGINCLRAFRINGTVVWGARTLRGADQLADEYKYIPVRRLALYIEESLYRGTQWVVFEPNDEPLWAQIRLNIGAFMQNLFRQGAFQGKTPQEAYFVKCDKETTIQNDINLGIVNIVVGFAPLKPAEFVVIKLQQIAGQIAT